MLEAGGRVHKTHTYPPGARPGAETEVGAGSQVEEAGKPLASLPSSALDRPGPGLRGLWVLCVAWRAGQGPFGSREVPLTHCFLSTHRPGTGDSACPAERFTVSREGSP